MTLGSASPVKMLDPHCRTGPVSCWAYLGALTKLLGPLPFLALKAQQLLNLKLPQVVEHGSTDFPCLLGGETQDTTTPKPQLPHLHGELA